MVVFGVVAIFFFISEEHQDHNGLVFDEEGFFLSESTFFTESALPNEYDGLDVVT